MYFVAVEEVLVVVQYVGQICFGECLFEWFGLGVGVEEYCDFVGVYVLCD